MPLGRSGVTSDAVGFAMDGWSAGSACALDSESWLMASRRGSDALGMRNAVVDAVAPWEPSRSGSLVGPPGGKRRWSVI